MGAVAAFVAYALHWEQKTEKAIPNAKIVSLQQYKRLGYKVIKKGYTIHIEGQDKPIEVPLCNWDNTVKKGDTVDLVVRREFLSDRVQAISIDDHK
jgi:hypothetical protein